MWRRLEGWSLSPGAVLLWTLFLLLGEKGLPIALLMAALCHELGHLLALRLWGVPVQGVEITAFGAKLKTEGRGRLSYGRELITVLAGPLANLFGAVCLAPFALRLPWEEGFLFVGAHLVLAGFNLLPVPPLDGGRALSLAASWLLGPVWGERACLLVAAHVVGLLLLGALWLCRESGGNLWLLLAALCLSINAGREMGLVKRARKG